MVDDATDQLENLRASVTAAIFQGHMDLENLIIDAKAIRDDRYTDTEVSLDTEYERVYNKLQTIKEYFDNAGANMTICLQWREAVVLELPNRCRNDMNDCLKPLDDEVEVVNTNANYTIDIIVTDVDAYDFQLKQCNGQILCLTSLITDIALAEERIPTKVQQQIDDASEQLDALKVPIGECMDAAAAYMVETGDGVVDYIGECLEDYLPTTPSK